MLLLLSVQESDASQKCLDAYNYDKSMCSEYFQQYKNCRKYWVSVFIFSSRSPITALITHYVSVSDSGRRCGLRSTLVVTNVNTNIIW